MDKWMQDYLETVSGELQWRPARPVVLRELRDHIEDQYEGFVTEGMEENKARQAALDSMGDPVEVGKALDAVHRPKSLKGMLVPIVAMLTISLFMWLFVFFDSDDPAHWIWMPFGATAVGLTVMTFMIHIKWNKLLPHLWKITLPVWILLMIAADLFYPDMSSRWTEYCALLAPLVYGSVVYGCRGKGIKGLLCSGAVLILLFWGMETFLFSALGSLCLFIVGTVLLFYTAACGGVGRKRTAYVLTVAILAVAFVLFVGNATNDVLRWRHINSDYTALYRTALRHSRALGAGEVFEIELWGDMWIMSPYALENIVIMGEGDFFLSSVIYRFGWLFGIVLAAAVLLLLVYVLRMGLRRSSVWSRFLTVAVIVPMLVQAGLHVVNNCGIFCISSQLPLLSYGNTHRIVDLCLMGLVFSTFRTRTILRDAPIKSLT